MCVRALEHIEAGGAEDQRADKGPSCMTTERCDTRTSPDSKTQQRDEPIYIYALTGNSQNVINGPSCIRRILPPPPPSLPPAAVFYSCLRVVYRPSLNQSRGVCVCPQPGDHPLTPLGDKSALNPREEASIVHRAAVTLHSIFHQSVWPRSHRHTFSSYQCLFFCFHHHLHFRFSLYSRLFLSHMIN